MSYRLITKAAISINGESDANIEIRAYAAPKGDPKGMITVDHFDVPFKLTSGAGRGQATKFYVYIPYGGTSAYFEVTEAQFADLKAGKPAIVFKPEPVAPVAETPKIDEKPVVKTKLRASKKVEDALV